jgi:hypothetical protein
MARKLSLRRPGWLTHPWRTTLRPSPTCAEVDLLPDADVGEATAAPSPCAPWGSWCSRPVDILLEIWMNVSRCINSIYYVIHKFYLQHLFCARPSSDAEAR